MAPTIREAIKKVYNHIKHLKATGVPIDRFHFDLLRDLQKYEHIPNLPLDSPRLQEA